MLAAKQSGFSIILFLFPEVSRRFHFLCCARWLSLKFKVVNQVLQLRACGKLLTFQRKLTFPLEIKDEAG